MRVEVVYALPTRQILLAVDVADGATVADVIDQSRLLAQFPEAGECQAGIWGKPVDRDHAVRDGDRVELYRPLEIDPKEGRRLKARV